MHLMMNVKIISSLNIFLRSGRRRTIKWPARTIKLTRIFVGLSNIFLLYFGPNTSTFICSFVDSRIFYPFIFLE